jgi:hypothetical protein
MVVEAANKEQVESFGMRQVAKELLSTEFIDSELVLRDSIVILAHKAWLINAKVLTIDGMGFVFVDQGEYDVLIEYIVPFAAITL